MNSERNMYKKSALEHNVREGIMEVGRISFEKNCALGRGGGP